MSHPDLPPIDELLAGHALGDLEEAEQEALRRHLAADPNLQLRLDELSTTLQLLPLGLPAQAQPPERLRRRLFAPRQAPHGLQPKPWRPSWGHLVMASLAGGLIVTGLQVQHLRQQLALQGDPWPLPSPALRVNRTMILKGSTPAGPMDGEVVVQPNKGYNLLRLEGVPPAPPRHIYRLWAEVEGRQVGCVEFVPDAGGVVSMPIPTEPSSSAQRLSISLEPLQPGGDQPRGPRVLTSL